MWYCISQRPISTCPVKYHNARTYCGLACIYFAFQKLVTMLLKNMKWQWTQTIGSTRNLTPYYHKNKDKLFFNIMSLISQQPHVSLAKYMLCILNKLNVMTKEGVFKVNEAYELIPYNGNYIWQCFLQCNSDHLVSR